MPTDRSFNSRVGGSVSPVRRAGHLKRLFWGAAVMFAVLAGAMIRLFIAPSHGAWDTEYWKAWASHAATSGYAKYYGPSESVPAGAFQAQLAGTAPRYEIQFRGRSYPIDYPPLGLFAWGESWRFFTSRPRPYRGDLAENVAVKFPAILGDGLGAGILLWLLRKGPRSGASLPLAYWLFPITWVSSAALGFFDGFVAPLLVLSFLITERSPLWGGVAFAAVVLTKPTAAVAVIALYLVTPAARWLLLTAGGLLGATLILAPYVLAGTLETAIVHIVRIFTQDRISGGYANPWWLFGHLWNVAEGRATLSAEVDYVLREAFPWDAGLLGFILASAFALFVIVIAIRDIMRRSGGGSGLDQSVRLNLAQTAFAAATLLFAWGLLTVGAHDNHNHPLFLLLCATGLGSPFLRWFTVVLATSTLLGSVALHGIGRFYGPEWRALLPLANAADALRMSLGFDLTLVLAAVNTMLFVWLLARLRNELEALSD
jgi:hypothetical protein